jgi:glyoxylase-like metal-dependent hydrolase (beta-lactamase superfamily II)
MPSTILRLAAALLVGALHAGTAAQGSPDPAPLDVTEVAPGVHVHAGRLEDWLPGNAGDVANLDFVVGSRCVAVIDTGGTPHLGLRWRAAIERATSLPICYVFDTHAHPDHVLGNAAFAGPDTRLRREREVQRRDGRARAVLSARARARLRRDRGA